MGIPYLKKWLRDHNLIKDLPANTKLIVDSLYIDGTEVLNYENVENIEATAKEELREIYLAEIDKLIQTFEPTTTLFIAIDGTCPVAKFQTLRRRRFQSTNEAKQEFINPNDKVPKVKFLPGDADNALKDLLRNREKLSNIKAKTFVYSGKFVPGEAEHKYFDYFRRCKKSSDWRKGQRHFIISKDNDLILLALQFIDEDFTIIQPNDNNNPYSIINVTEVRKYLIDQIRAHIPNRRQFKEDKAIKDIIGLSFLLGNDFLPTFQDIRSQSSNFDKLLNSYYQFNNKPNTSYKYLILNDVFLVFNLCEILSNFFNKDLFKTGSKNSRISSSNQNKKAQEVLRTLNFTMIYYTDGLPSWTYYFPYNESPKIQDVCCLMKQESKEFFDTIEDKEIPDFLLKLLIILPVHFNARIPKLIHNIKTNTGLAQKYWPVDGRIPIFKYDEIKIAYKSVLNQLTDNEINLNRFEELIVLCT